MIALSDDAQLLLVTILVFPGMGIIWIPLFLGYAVVGLVRFVWSKLHVASETREG